VEGYGVYLTQHQLDHALDQSGNVHTNLMNVFFQPDVLASSSVYGTRKHPALDRDIVSACIHEYIYSM